MNQFVSPQFIDVEDRIIGPITTRQFVMMVIGGIVIFLSYKIFDTGFFILISLIVFILVIVFGFIKINGRHFSGFLGSMIIAIKRPKLRVWHKQVSLNQVLNQKQDTSQIVKSDFSPRKKTVKSKHLSELALLVDTGGRFNG